MFSTQSRRGAENLFPGGNLFLPVEQGSPLLRTPASKFCLCGVDSYLPANTFTCARLFRFERNERGEDPRVEGDLGCAARVAPDDLLVPSFTKEISTLPISGSSQAAIRMTRDRAV